MLCCQVSEAEGQECSEAGECISQYSTNLYSHCGLMREGIILWEVFRELSFLQRQFIVVVVNYYSEPEKYS